MPNKDPYRANKRDIRYRPSRGLSWWERFRLNHPFLHGALLVTAWFIKWGTVIFLLLILLSLAASLAVGATSVLASLTPGIIWYYLFMCIPGGVLFYMEATAHQDSLW